MPIVLSSDRKYGVINSFKLGGARAEHYYATHACAFIEAFGSVIDKAYFIWPNENDFSTIKTELWELTPITSYYLALVYSKEALRFITHRLASYMRELTEIGFDFTGTVDEWPDDWEKISPRLTKFTFHGSITRSALETMCNKSFSNLKYLDINIKQLDGFAGEDTEWSEIIIADAVKVLLSKCGTKLETFKSNIASREFHVYLARTQPQLKEIGFDLTAGGFSEPFKWKSSYKEVTTLWIDAKSSADLKNLPHMNSNIQSLSLGGFALDSKTVDFISRLPSINHLSLFYMTGGTKLVPLVENIVALKQSTLDVIELPWEKSLSMSIHGIFRIKKTITVIIWLEWPSNIEYELREWYSLKTLQCDRTYEVFQVNLPTSALLPSKLRMKIKSGIF